MIITAWINPNLISSWDRIAAKSHTLDATPWTMYGLMFDDADHIRFEVAIGGLHIVVDGLTVIPNGSSINLYVNGVPDNSVLQSGAIDTNDMPLSVGRSGFGSNYFNGTIDDVRIYNRSLTAEEILEHYNEGIIEYHRADNNPQDGNVCMGELLDFIASWKYDSTAYPMREMMEAIGLWKVGGC